MREIKFRQPIFDNGKFIKFHYWGTLDKGLSFIAPITGKGDDIRKSQEYTGQNDKNGNEIWEGDITNMGVIEFQNNLNWDGGGSEHSGFYFKTYEDCGDLEWYDCLIDCEVIGNVWQNPELNPCPK